MKRAAIIAAVLALALGVVIAVKKCPPVPVPAGPEAPKTSPPIAAPVAAAPPAPVNVPAVEAKVAAPEAKAAEGAK